jgi:hypothetical protein
MRGAAGIGNGARTLDSEATQPTPQATAKKTTRHSRALRDALLGCGVADAQASVADAEGVGFTDCVAVADPKGALEGADVPLVDGSALAVGEALTWLSAGLAAVQVALYTKLVVVLQGDDTKSEPVAA